MHVTLRRTKRLHIAVMLAVLSLGAPACSGEKGADGTSEGETDMAEKLDDHAESGAHGEHEHTNRLVHEKSPYLLQHAHNPVDWYAWGEEALAEARKQDKPIFLSIGYSTCHWCHVMERESFENEEIAALMNEFFINIKVDREERPDLDMLYMNAVQAMTGRGGWPMSVWLTPDLEPFYAGTYFPPTDGRGMPGFPTLIQQIGTTWRDDRARIDAAGDRVGTAMTEEVQQLLQSSGGGELNAGVLDTAFQQLSSRYDAQEGGFGSQPKFPMPHYARFLLRYAHRTGTDEATQMATHTLEKMAMGGMHDHLAGGFHRYSTDRVWLAPHFEKMLYDQAGLALAYTDAWLITRNDAYRTVARGILDYVMRYLTHPDGGFYSAEDADSEGEEGTFYVWSVEEVDELLGDRSGAFKAAYDVTPHGNWEEKTILRTRSLEPFDDPELATDRAKLLERRDRRIRPHLDDKVIVSWNGFMIEAFAYAGRSFGDERHLDAARRAAGFVRDRLWNGDRLLRHYRDGAASITGYLEDYAFYGRGLVALYEATFESEWLELASAVAGRMIELFDHESGMLTFYGSDQEQLLTPVIESHDGAMPSGASAAAHLLLRLGHLTADTSLASRGERLLDAYAGTVSRMPTGLLELVNALDFSLGPRSEVVIAGEPDDRIVREMWAVVNGEYRPNTVLLHRPPGRPTEILRLAPYLEAQVAIGGKPTAYVCENYACKLPVHDREALLGQLDGD